MLFLFINLNSKLKNVILGPNSIKNIYCVGNYSTIENVWWEDVCKDAITIDSTNRYFRYFIKGGGAKNGSGNIIQHNSPGIIQIENFYVENSKQFYSSCENCKNGFQSKRIASLINVTASNVETLVGYNAMNFDVVYLKNVTFTGKHVCRLVEGKNDGKEERTLGYACESNSIRECICNSKLK